MKLVEQIAHPLANTRGNNKKTLVQREWGTCIYHASTKWFLTLLAWPAELKILHFFTFRLGPYIQKCIHQTWKLNANKSLHISFGSFKKLAFNPPDNTNSILRFFGVHIWRALYYHWISIFSKIILLYRYTFKPQSRIKELEASKLLGCLKTTHSFEL